MSSTSGSRIRMSTATSAMPISSSRRVSTWAAGTADIGRLPPHLEGEQSLRAKHQDADDDDQRKNFRHRPGQNTLQRRSRLRDGERSCDGTEKALRAAEAPDEKGTDDVELAGGRSGGTD